MANDQLVMELDGTLKGEHECRVEAAIKRLQAFEPSEGYYLAFSGGKDSQCIYHLAKMAGVKFDAHYYVTSVDPPEAVRFIKTHYPDVTFDFPRDKDGKVITMWNLIPRKAYPPTRVVRYCCAMLKESQGGGRVVITGVRWAESTRRAMNRAVVTLYNGKDAAQVARAEGVDFRTNKSGGLILNDDNDAARRTVEQCYRTNKTLVNPIVDWEDKDVWRFLDENGIEHCKLYDKGWHRIGCIGCPMASTQEKERMFSEHPQYKRYYVKAFERLIKANAEKGNTFGKGKTAEDIMDWWIYGQYNRHDTMDAWEVDD